ncbi:alkane 1-monooxygenase [Moritella sp. F3]|uniref:alkane 1-monooxygenase n=1 Tax=Moritella sp. F3 TaxID=2718882 RepID=UPI0018E120BF|nr:alkane 1-monooxygenase [Moritella sp. F3]GIC78645.1 alkane monooxygenase [Moritella sp. F1]GIC79816.1 alkane monooxygenase [Moritella sp. F3]
MKYLGTFTAHDGTTYTDKKRYFWLLSLLLPSIAAAGPLLFMAFNHEFILWFFFLFSYGFFPIMDHVMGEDTSNPPEVIIPQLEADPFYRHITILHVPVVIVIFIFCGWFIGNYELSWSGYLATALLAGNVGGHGLNIGHELGHKKNKFDRKLAKLVLAVAAYGHFFIEHNQGHHKHVATPEDPASSKMGENIYHFAIRELPGAILRAYHLEKRRLNKLGKSTYSFKNEFFQSILLSFTIYASLAVWLGSGVIPYLFISAFWSMWQLTSANYIEHYGLLRKKLPNGKYERPQPHHSWNSNHVFSNWALFHLQRHSDHHANATRSYQSLRHFNGLPTLPNGYFGMYPIAYIPWLWFKVMDKRIVNITDGDVSKINMLPIKREQLIAKYKLT